jgi:DNA-directed RNA polymerase specialized sigma24 family protein
VAAPTDADLYWQTARAVCTEKQLRVLELRERHGFSLRTIALATGSALWTVRDHVDAAHRRIYNALEEQAPESPL